MKITTSDNKYTFIVKEGDWEIEVLRNNEPWKTITNGHNAIFRLMSDLEEARKQAIIAESASHMQYDYIIKELKEIQDKHGYSEYQEGIRLGLQHAIDYILRLGVGKPVKYSPIDLKGMSAEDFAKAVAEELDRIKK